LIKLYDIAYRTLKENDWSKDKALKALDYDYDRFKFMYRQGSMTKDELDQTLIGNENVQSLIGFVPVKEMKNWPEYRKKHIAKYGEP
jgi:hypothetical protein